MRTNGDPIVGTIRIKSTARPNQLAVNRIMGRQVLGSPDEDRFHPHVVGHNGRRVTVIAFNRSLVIS